jgi:hypothetical protein
MTTAPKLPPLPESFRHFPKVERDMMQAHALAAYQAGRDAGIDETIAACLTSLKELGVINRLELSERIRDIVAALKSNKKGGV